MQPINIDRALTELPDLLSPTACRSLRARLSAGIVPTGAHYPPRYRDNDRALLHDALLAASLWQTLAPRLPTQAVDPAGRRWEAVGLNPRIRLCRYNGGQAFVRHRDGAWHGDGVRSWLTFQLYLDADFDGGRTRFDDRHVVPRTGAAVVFDHRLWHDGEPVTRGTKHVLRSDVLFRPLDPVPDDGHRGYVWRLATHALGLLSSGRDGTVRLWGPDGRALRIWTGGVGPLAARGQGWVGGTRDGRWRDDEGHERPAHAGAVLDVVPFGDGFASCGADGFVRGWTGALAPTFAVRVHQGWAWRLWVAGDTLWSVGDDWVLARTVGGRSTIVRRHPSALLAVGDDLLGDADGLVTDFAGRPLQRHAGRIRAVLRHRGQVLSAGEDDVVRCGDVVVRRHRDFVTDLVGTRDGCASASYDGTVVR